MKAVSKVLGLAFLAMAGSLMMPQVAVAAPKKATDKCGQVYRDYPITQRCGNSGYCIEQNAKNRQIRVSKGCKAFRM
jgi:hypothetical protein